MNRLEFVFNAKVRKRTSPVALINHNLAVYIDGEKITLVQDLQISASVTNGSQLVRAYVKIIRAHEDGSICMVDGDIREDEINPGMMTDSLIVEKIEKDKDDVLNFHLRRKAI